MNLFLGSSPTKRGEDSDGIVLDDRLVLVGVAISWENRDAYYIALTHQDPQGGTSLAFVYQYSIWVIGDIFNCQFSIEVVVLICSSLPMRNGWRNKLNYPISQKSHIH